MVGLMIVGNIWGHHAVLRWSHLLRNEPDIGHALRNLAHSAMTIINVIHDWHRWHGWRHCVKWLHWHLRNGWVSRYSGHSGHYGHSGHSGYPGHSRHPGTVAVFRDRCHSLPTSSVIPHGRRFKFKIVIRLTWTGDVFDGRWIGISYWIWTWHSRNFAHFSGMGTATQILAVEKQTPKSGERIQVGCNNDSPFIETCYCVFFNEPNQIAEGKLVLFGDSCFL